MGFDDNYSEGTSTAGSRYFTAKSYVGAFAILIEFKDFKRDVPLFKPREQVVTDRQTNAKSIKVITHEDIAFADLTIFASEEHIENGKPSAVLLNQKIAQRLLAADLASEKPGALLVKRLQVLPSNAMVWRPVEGDVIKKVGAYFDAREAEIAAAMSGGDEGVPAMFADA